MEPYSLDLIAPDGSYVASGSLDLDETNGLFTGWIGLDDTQAAIRSVFEEFEEIVEGQMLSLLDDVAAKIQALSLRVVFNDKAAQVGRPYVSPTTLASVRAVFEGDAAHPVEDLQVFPSRESVSFRLATCDLTSDCRADGMTISSSDARSASVSAVIVAEETLTVELIDGRSISVLLSWYPRLLHASDEERGRWRSIGRGEGLHWPDLDEDISVKNLLDGKPSGEGQRSLRAWLDGRSSNSDSSVKV